MEKVFNLNIDTKDKKIMDIKGLKQFDNSSVLYINITQNSVSFDLTDCTARLNFLKEDGEVLLYMADIIDAKNGKVKIKLSTQVLKNPGIVKVDLSIFDKNIMKITSLDFTMQIEKSIYSNEYYLQRADFDIVQSMHIEEEKRLKNERDRIAAEHKRESSETTRLNQENTRQDNEKKRIEAENKRTTAENTRADNELGRITTEAGRTTEEKKRATAEATRVNQENKRIEEEKEREIAEKTRQAEYIKNKNLIDNFSVCQAYDPKASYKKFNRIVFNGSTYECLKDCTGIDPGNKENWICIAEKGNGNMSTSTYDKNNNGKVDVAEIAESIEWNNVKNKPNIEKIEEQIKENSIKTVTKEANIVDLENHIGGTANIVLEGNTVDIVKEPIVSDFKGKVKGSTKENFNIVKSIRDTTLKSPESFTYEFESSYLKNIFELDGKTIDTTTNSKNLMSQQLFSFDIVSIVERKIGKIQKDTRKERTEWVKKNIKSLKCNWYGYGACSSGNKAYLDAFDATHNDWNIKRQKIQDSMCNKSNSPHIIVYNTKSTDYLTADGFIHFIAYTDASDGKTASTIYTDYVDLEVQLNPILKSVGEREENKIEIKSVGKNLFDISRMNEEKYGAGSSVLDNIINLSENSIETSNNNSTTRGKGYIAHVKPNVDYTISFDVVEGHGYFNISGDYNWHEQRINFQEKRKYSSVIRTSTGKFEFSLNVLNSSSNSIVKIKNIQLEEGLTSPSYVNYKEDKALINLKEPLRGLLNGVRDSINTDGTITRRVGKIIFNGTEKWDYYKSKSGKIEHFAVALKDVNGKHLTDQHILCDSFSTWLNGWGGANTDTVCTSSDVCLQIGFNFTIGKYTIDTWKQYLKNNPTTVYYELAEPIVEATSQPLTLQSYLNGTVLVDTEIAPFITVKYPSNINSRISSVEEANSKIKDNLGGAWRTLLILADKDLKMKSIQPLSSTDTISKKINEIIGVW